MHSSDCPIGLEAVVHTVQLCQRPRRPPDCEAETRALVSVAQLLAHPPRDILQRLAEAALELCDGGSAGVSIIEDDGGKKVFRWHALTGALASHRWGTTPRDFSPCGIVIDRNAVQLMILPERHFEYLINVKPQVVEVLLVPFSIRGQPVGTIWVVAHDHRRKFDAEDERLVKELAQFAAAAYELASSVRASQLGDRRRDEFLATLAQELRSPLSEMNDPARQPAGDLAERQLKSMKRKIIELLDRSRIHLEAVAATCTGADGLPVDAHLPGTSIPTPARGAARTTATRSSQRAVAPASDCESLLRRMRWGDQCAFAELYDHTAKCVYALAWTILKSAEDAEEVVCDTYAQAWRQSERFDAERASPIGWLLMICRGRAIDRLRHNRHRGAARTVALDSVCEPAHDSSTPEELLSLFHDGSRVQEALGALSPARLMLVQLAFFEGLSVPEMAERTGMPLGTVKSHIRRALIDLRRRLQASERASTVGSIPTTARGQRSSRRTAAECSVEPQ